MLPLLLGISAAITPPYDGPKIELTKIAEGVYATVFADDVDAAMNGNGLVVVNDSDVLVVDTQETPEAARRVIAEIKKVTRNPVRYVVNTHWHGDHHFGNQAYREAYPSVEFVSHPYTREDMPKEAPGLKAWVEQGLPKEIAEYQQRMETAAAEKRPVYEKAIERDQWWLEQLKTVHMVPADLLVADSITLVRGQRTIVVRYLGRANTRGDLVVYLPREHVLATGDIVVNPMPYATESYLADWIKALDQVRALGPSVIVPGHGAIEHDFRYVDLVRRLLVSTLGQARDAVAKGLDLEAARKAVDIDSLRALFTGGDPRRQMVFDGNYTTPAVDRAWLEARGDSAFK